MKLTHWNGRPLEQLRHVELIEAVQELSAQLGAHKAGAVPLVRGALSYAPDPAEYQPGPAGRMRKGARV